MQRPDALVVSLGPLICKLALDAYGDLVGYRCHRLEHRVAQPLAGEHCHDADQAILNQERVAGKGHHSFPLSPILIVDSWVADNAIGQMRLTLLCD